MSHFDDTLQEALEQHLESLKARGKADDWLRDVVQWLPQEILDLEFSQLLGVDPYPEGYCPGVNAAPNVRFIGIHAVRSPPWRAGCDSTSKDQVSSIALELDEELGAWRSRPLDMDYPYLVVEAHYYTYGVGTV